MLKNDFHELTGLKNIPVYWDKRYTKNLDKISKPVYTVKKESDVPIKLRDGVTIYTDIYHPAEGGAFPGLLTWSAYGKEMQELKRGSLSGRSLYFDHSLEAGDIDFFVERATHCDSDQRDRQIRRKNSQDLQSG